MKIIIKNGNILLPNGLKKVHIEIEDGIITKISKNLVKDNSAQVIDAKGKYILPGFIDLHTNGIGGFDLTNGWYDYKKESFSVSKEKYLSGIENSMKEFAKHGTTLVGFTALEAPIEKIKKIFSYIADYKNKSESILKDIFYGIYIEGVFMKDERYKGAHNPKYFFKPSIKLFDELQNAAGGHIKIVNVVPEWGKDAFNLIAYLKKKKILVAAGHTSATGDEYTAAIKNGLQLAIHVLNGPSSSSFKPFDNGGALETLLKSPQMHLEIIPDGYHVDKSYLMDILKRKGIDKCIAISDSMFVTNMKKVNEYIMNGVVGKLSKNGEFLYIADKGNFNALFGSVLTMDKAFENLISWFMQPIEGVWNELHKPLGFADALLNASKMCSQNPASILGLKTTGSIAIGNNADILVTEILNNNTKYKLRINKVLLKGNIIFEN
ncbi:MAG: amidohydrolase family protein [Melioribacteraceae bacterium]|nr:amidohydrolase family protein [Melioribacteraceae bacterium]